MKFIYKTTIITYSLLVKVASLFNAKARQFVQGRKNWKEKVASKADPRARYIWFHCASLGEFEQGRPVIESIRKKFPEYRIVLTFFSPSGFEVRKNYEHAEIVMYLPLDTRSNARTFINLIRPEKAFFIKYEYWYFFMDELKKQHIPLYIISAIFRKSHYFFRKGLPGNWFRKMLLKTEHLFVQNETSGKLLQSIGISNYTVSGDTRFDRVMSIARTAKSIPLVEKFKGDKLLLVAGSTWKHDEELLAAFINSHPKMKVVFAPHEVTESNMNRLEQLLKNRTIRFSKATETDAVLAQVLIIDSVGILSSLYQYGNLAYIGGGFGVGIHNILEAATYGLPVIFGPNYKKFKEAVDLEKMGGAFPIQNFNQLETILGDFLDNPAKLTEPSVICKNYVEKNVGSTNIIIKKVFNN